MNIDEMISNNKEIVKEIDHKKMEIKELEKKIISPCVGCKYGEEKRCHMCKSEYYFGFNEEFYPIIFDEGEKDEG